MRLYMGFKLYERSVNCMNCEIEHLCLGVTLGFRSTDNQNVMRSSLSYLHVALYKLHIT